MSIYIHVPFCRTKCAYCDFYSLVPPYGPLLDSVASKLIEEVSYVASDRSKPFETVFIGGGNPGCLPIASLQKLIDAVFLCGHSGECSIEINPESLDRRVERLIESGVTRLSIGLQSFDPENLALIGRNAPLDATLKGIRTALKLRDTTKIDLNFDLITCIPGQTVVGAISDIDRLVETTGPEHISLYCLTIEENTPLAKRIDRGELKAMDDLAQSDILSACWERLAMHGYDHYEVSNFARTDKKTHYCQHNLRYWQAKSHIGIGPTAVGTAYAGSSAIRMKGVGDAALYAAEGIFSNYSFERLEMNELIEEFLIVSLRTRWGIEKKVFNERFGYEFDEAFSSAIERYDSIWKDLVVNDTKRFKLTEKGMMVLDSILIALATAFEISNTKGREHIDT